MTPPHTHTHRLIADTLSLLHQPAIVGHDLALWEVEPHLQGNQDGELQRYELSAVDAETLLQLLFIRGDEQRDKRSVWTVPSDTYKVTSNTLLACTFSAHNRLHEG